MLSSNFGYEHKNFNFLSPNSFISDVLHKPLVAHARQDVESSFDYEMNDWTPTQAGPESLIPIFFYSVLHEFFFRFRFFLGWPNLPEAVLNLRSFGTLSWVQQLNRTIPDFTHEPAC